ncbi:MAG: ABC transporter permease [Clostridia bacterium]|nr:ABC transporter permease [Clostridia bacterium]
MAKSLRRILILTKRNLKEIVRDPLSLVFTILLPLFMEILFYFLFRGKTDQFDMKYLAPGIVAFAQSFIALFTGILISVDRSTSFLTRLYVSETRSFEFIFSYALAVLPISLVQAVLFFVVGGIIDTSIFCAGMLAAIPLSLVSALFFIAFGILLGSVCNEKAIGGVASVVISGQSLLSGMWFPKEGLNPVMVKVMDILPFKNTAVLIQNPVTGIANAWTDFFLPLLIVIAYAALIFAVAILAFSRKMKQN